MSRVRVMPGGDLSCIVTDTCLRVAGAIDWMPKAQCFTGVAESPLKRSAHFGKMRSKSGSS